MYTRIQWPTTLALLLLSAVPAIAAAAPAHDAHRGYVYDNRYNHGHYYPQRGASFRALPQGGYRVPCAIRWPGVRVGPDSGRRPASWIRRGCGPRTGSRSPRVRWCR